MTIEEAKAAVEEIRAIAVRGDHEKAHSREDDLRRRVLQHIASGADGAADLARVALVTECLDFERWCA